MSRAVAAARQAFDEGPWPRLTHAERAEYLRALAAGLEERNDVLGAAVAARVGRALQDLAVRRDGSARARSRPTPRWPTRSRSRRSARRRSAASSACSCASRSASSARSSRGTRRSRSSATRSAPRSSPGARSCSSRRRRHRARATCSPRSRSRSVCRPACSTSSPPTARCRSCSSRDPGVDKITFTGSTAAGRRIASLCGERIARCTLELGGKSAAVDPRRHGPRDRGQDARPRRVRAQRPGVLVADAGHRDEEPPRRARRSARGDRSVRRGSATRSTSSRSSGRSSSDRQRDRVEGYIAKGVDEGATLATGGGRPEGPRPRLLRRADRLRQRRQRIDDRSRGDLRAGAAP